MIFLLLWLKLSFYNPSQELDLHDIPSFDSEFGKILLELYLLVCQKKYLELMGDDSGDAIADLHFRGTLIEDLCLDFTLPGHPDYILKPGDETVYFKFSFYSPSVFLPVNRLF